MMSVSFRSVLALLVAALVLFMDVSPAAASQSCGNCDYIIPAGASNTNTIDNDLLNLAKGSTICFDTKVNYVKGYSVWNFISDSSKPFIFTNCDGPVSIAVDNKQHALMFQNSKNIKLLGNGDKNTKYGIKITKCSFGVGFVSGSTDVEMAYVEIADGQTEHPHAAVTCKSDPQYPGDPSRLFPEYYRKNFVMENVIFHDNYLHNTGTEGFYIGYYNYHQTFPPHGAGDAAHEIHGLKVYNNIFEDTRWDSLQVGCSTEDVEIYNNIISNPGSAGTWAQNQGMIIQSGTKNAKIYNNVVTAGSGTAIGILFQGSADSYIYNNVVDMQHGGSSVSHGLSVSLANDVAQIPSNMGTWMEVSSNTVYNPKGTRGINWFYGKVTGAIKDNGVSYNNAITYGGSATWECLTGAFKPGTASGGNFCNKASESSQMQYTDAAKGDFTLKASSPLVGFGVSGGKGFPKDFFGSARPRSGSVYDAGAFQLGSVPSEPSTECNPPEVSVRKLKAYHKSANLHVTFKTDDTTGKLRYRVYMKYLKSKWIKLTKQSLKTEFKYKKADIEELIDLVGEWKNAEFKIKVKSVDTQLKTECGKMFSKKKKTKWSLFQE